jgi:hypothetical protein
MSESTIVMSSPRRPGATVRAPEVALTIFSMSIGAVPAAAVLTALSTAKEAVFSDAVQGLFGVQRTLLQTV